MKEMNKNIMNRIKQNKIWLTILFTLCIGLLHTHRANASDNVEKIGEILQYVIPGIAYGSTFYLKDSEGRKQFYKSFFTNLAVTHGLKNVINKKRPNGQSKSFPSGHTSTAFQGATFIQKRYGIKYAIPAYIAASFVGYSRLKSDNHYTKDVIAGAAIGVVSSFYFTKPYKGFNIKPIVNNGRYGLSISKQW